MKPSELLAAVLVAHQQVQPHWLAVDVAEAEQRKLEAVVAELRKEKASLEHDNTELLRAQHSYRAGLEQLKEQHAKTRREQDKEFGELQSRNEAEAKKLAEVLRKKNRALAELRELLNQQSGE